MNKLRVLLAHNYYQQAGGEDIVFAAEKELLQSHGHEVIVYTESNSKIKEMGYLYAASNMIWSEATRSKLKKLLVRTKPDIVHFHNIFVLISPAAYYACKELNIPIVQTLHNYRLLCSNALFFRNGTVCEKCLTVRAPLWGVVHKCYRGSRAQSAAVAAMLGYHRIIGTWKEQVDCYIALTRFARQKFIQGGLPPSKIQVKPNFVTNPSELSRSTDGDYILFVGRLSNEKGIGTLLTAWKNLRFPLRICGNGPLQYMVQQYVGQSTAVEYMGHLSHSAALDLFKQARFTVFTSEAFENFPMTIVESFSNAVPVVASALGAAAELISHEKTGLLYAPGDSTDLAAKVEWLWNHPEESERMGRNARNEYEQKYTPERNYRLLMDIYYFAIENRKKQ